MHSGQLDRIAIMTAARLLESASYTLALDHSNAWNPMGKAFRDIANPLSGHVLFDSSSEQPDFHFWLTGIDEHVHMLRHDHIGPQIDRPFSTRPLNCLDEPLSDTIGGEKLVSAKGGERQFSRVA